MMKPNLSLAASGLLRALIARTAVERDRILLTDWRSVDWQSLTFLGERHEIGLRISGPDSARIAAMIVDGLGDAEFAIPGQIVADIGLAGPLLPQADGSILVSLEALTIKE